MPVKIARSAPRPSLGLPELLVAIHTSQQPCCKAGKARIIYASSGVIRGIPVGSATIETGMGSPAVSRNVSTPYLLILCGLPCFFDHRQLNPTTGALVPERPIMLPACTWEHRS